MLRYKATTGKSPHTLIIAVASKNCKWATLAVADLAHRAVWAYNIYCIDTGLSNDVDFAFSVEPGKVLENLAFLALWRRAHEIYYHVSHAGYEVDFYLPETRQLIQMTQNLENAATQARRNTGDGRRPVSASPPSRVDPV